jgi:hypothetical protein
VEQRGGDLAAHPLPEGELPDRRREELREVDARDELLAPRAVAGVRQPVDGGEDAQRVLQRQVPPQLRPLAEDDADPPRELAALP